MSKIDLNTGLINNAKWLPSPYCDDRPVGSKIDLIVIHNISLPVGQFSNDYVEQLFMGTLDCTRHSSFSDLQGLKVSAHIFIKRNGDVVQFVPFHKRAWHAGKSFYKNRENCNDFSIGIELEGCDDLFFTDTQYMNLSKILCELIDTYPEVTKENIVGHSDIAPGRKTDPGPKFDWKQLHCIMAQEEA